MTALLWILGWILGGLLTWAALATGIAVTLGRAITTADERCGPCDVDAYELERLADGGVFL